MAAWAVLRNRRCNSGVDRVWVYRCKKPLQLPQSGSRRYTLSPNQSIRSGFWSAMVLKMP